MSYKVLYVEDEPFLSHIVSDGLKRTGYTVETIADGNLVIDAFKKMNPDICVLDIMLPSKDGYMLAEEIRAIEANVPIIFLSAKALSEDVVKGFRSGGNDYLKKPFSMDELIVRLESLLQRFGKNNTSQNETTTQYNFGQCKLDMVSQLLTTRTGNHQLSYKESALLEMMLLRRNDVLERQDALLKIWGDDNYYNTRSMDVFMAHLRKLLKDEPSIQIMSLRGVGYKLIC